MVKEKIVEAKSGQGNEGSQTKTEKLYGAQENDSDSAILNLKSEIRNIFSATRRRKGVFC